MIIFLIIFAATGWWAAFYLMKERNKAFRLHSEDIKAFRNKVVDDLGFGAYVEYSKETDWHSFTQVVLEKKVNLVKKES